MYSSSTLCRYLSLRIIMWSRHSRHSVPMTRSAIGFCQGLRVAVGVSFKPNLLICSFKSSLKILSLSRMTSAYYDRFYGRECHILPSFTSSDKICQSFLLPGLTLAIRPYLLRLCKSLNSFLALKFEQVSSSQRKKGDSLSLPIISFVNLIQSPQLVLPDIMPFDSKYLQFPQFCFILGIRSKSLPFIF